MKAPSRFRKRWLVGLMALAVVFGLVSIAAATLIGSGFETLTLGNYYYIGDTVEFYGYAFNDTTAEPILSAEVTEVFVRRYDGTAPSGYQDIYLLEASDPPIQLPSIDDKVLFYPDKMVIDYADATPDETVFTDYSNALSWTLAADTPLDANQRFKAEWHVLGLQENPNPDLGWDEFEKIDTVRRTMLKPSTIADVSVSASTVHTGEAVDITVTEFNNGNAALNTPSVDVLVNGVPYDTLTKAGAPAGDTLNDGILGIGETWSWVIEDVVVTEDSTIKVIGHGIDPNGNDVTVPADPAMAMPWEDPEEEASVEVDTITPGTEMTINALDPSTFYVGADVKAMFHETNTGDVALSDVYAEIWVDGVMVDTILKGSDLAVGETWDFDYTTPALDGGGTICAVGFGTDPLGKVITFEEYPERACVDYDTITPGTEMTVSALPNGGVYYKGDDVTAYFTEENTGDVELTDVYAEIWVDGVMVDTKVKGAPLAAGEKWDFDYMLGDVTEGATICAVGFGTDPLGKVITFEEYPERACVDFRVINPGTLMTVDALAPSTFYVGTDVIASFHEENTGDVALTDVYAEIWVDGVLVDTKIKGTLAVGETWDFDHTTPALAGGGTICAVGFGTDPLGKVITWDEYPERACVDYDTLTPGTEMTVDALPNGGVYYKGDDVTAYFHETNTGDVALTDIYAWVNTTGVDGEGTMLVGPASLAAGASWDFDYTMFDVQAGATIYAFGHGTDPLGKDIKFDEYPEKAEVPFTVITPGTEMTVDALDPSTFYVGADVKAMFHETNTGDVALSDVYAEIWVDGVMVDTILKGSDLAVGETWDFDYTTPALDGGGTICAVGFGTDPLGKVITFEEYPERACVDYDTITPGTEMTVDALDPSTFYVGADVKAMFHETNTGDVALSDVYAEIWVDGVMVDTILKGSDLAVGETWDFDYTTPALDGGGTICAVGFGTDPLGKVITFEEYPERACVDYDTITPGTEMTVDALDPSTFYVGADVKAMFHETNTGDVALSDVYAEIWVDGVMVDTILKGSDLAVGETWDFDYTTPALDGGGTICAVGFGTDPLGKVITFEEYPERACVDYDTITPGTEMTVDALPNGGEYDSGADVTAHFHEANSGDVVLTDVKAEIWVDGVLVDTILKGADLVVGETWDFDYTVSGVTAAGEICAVGFGTDPLGNVITFPDYPEKACVSWTVRTYGPTRTVGFWGQHYDYTLHVFSTELGGSIPLCDGKPIDSIQKVMAILNYDSILSKKEVAKMTPYEIKWLNCARQYVAAVLNYEAFGTAPEYMGEPIDFADVRMALCTGDADAIGDYLMKLDWFNNSHDDEYMYPLYGADEHFGPDENYWAPASPQKARFEGSSAIIWVRNLPVMP